MKKAIATAWMVLVMGVGVFGQTTNPMERERALSAEQGWKSIAFGEPLIFLAVLAVIDGRARTREEVARRRKAWGDDLKQ